MPIHFPSVDRKHLISNGSKDLFALQRPSTWEYETRDGDSDFGFDMEIQVAPNGQVCHTFRVQLKGTESPTISRDGSTLSIELSRTTLNLYANTLEPVLLVVAVVELAENGKANTATSKVYWQWMTDELRRLRGSPLAIDESLQVKVTVHVPLSNVLHPDLDVVPYLQKRIDESRAVESLGDLMRNAVETTSGPLDDPIQWLLSKVASDPTRLNSLLSLDDGEESRPREGTPQFLIAEIRSHLRSGKTSLAEALVHRLDRSQFESTPKLKASLLSLEGKIAMQRMRKVDALRLFEEAYQLHPVEPHLLAQEEVRFIEAVDREDRAAIVAIARVLAGVQTDDGLGLLVRVQVSIDEFDAAAETLARIGQPKRSVPALVLLSGQKKWVEVQVEAERALSQPDIPLQDSVGLNLIAARACWQQAMETTSLSADDTEIPLPGVPGLNIRAAEATWEHSKACLQGLKELGWSVNIELLAPVAVVSASATGKQEQALPMLKEAAAERPEYLVLQENLELLAISLGNHDVALQANARQPQSHDVLVRRSCLLFQAKQYAECLAAVEEVESGLGSPCKQTPMALAMGFAAASKLARTDDANRLMAALQSKAVWGAFVFFAEFVRQSMETGTPNDPLAHLREGLREFPASHLLAANLYSNLRVDEAPEATEAIFLARLLRQGAAFTMEEWLHLIAAHVTLEHWQDAETEARLAVERFGETDRFMSMLAVAVEMQGKTGEAMELLERAVSLGQRRFTTLHNYLGLCLRLGRMAAAQETIEKLLAVESDRNGRLELLRLNALILAQQELNDRALAVAKEIGRFVNPNVEIEEGMYLNLHMAVTVNIESVSDAEQQSFWQRVDAFCETWPESTLFRRVNMPDQGLATIDDVHDMLDVVLGDSRGQLRTFQQRERQARSGDLPVPFVARPSFVLHYIGDCFTLWDVAKRSRSEDQQFHLTSIPLDGVQATERILRDIPLLDLPALMILRDLGLFEILFSIFPRVAVPRSTVDYLGQNARGLLVNSGVSEAASALLTVINDNLHRIDQPSIERAVKVVSPRDLLEDFVQLARSGRWAIYTDDAITLAWIQVDHTNVIHLCTVDLLTLADSAELLTAVEVAFHLEQLVSWNVGINVASRYLMAALDGALNGTPFLSASERLDRFHVHQPFAKLARAIWNFKKSPSDLVSHMGTLAAEMLVRPQTEPESAAAVWAFWFNRVKMAPGFNELGWDPLCYSLMTALKQLPLSTAQRAVGTFLTVVETVLSGADHITRQEQKIAIGRLGALVGKITRRNPAAGEDIRSKVTTALVQGTEDGDTFNTAYLAALQDEDSPPNS